MPYDLRNYLSEMGLESLPFSSISTLTVHPSIHPLSSVPLGVAGDWAGYTLTVTGLSTYIT